jgi:lysophospholipase L1-like esterase
MARSRSLARRAFQFPLVGGGGAPFITVTPDTWNFGTTPVGTPVTKVFTIKNADEDDNPGSAALEITLPITSDNAAFTITAQPGSTSLAPGASTTYTVQATAASAGTPNGNISIVNNSAENPKLVAIQANVEPVVILDDTFTSASTAPIATPRTAEPSPGRMVITQPVTSKHTISGGNLNLISGTANDNVRWVDGAGANFSRVGGRSIKMQLRFASGATGEILLRDGSANRISGIQPVGATLNFKLGVNFAFQPNVQINIDQELVWTMGAAGTKLILFDGISYNLMALEELSNAAAFYVELASPANFTSEYIEGFDIGTALDDSNLLMLNESNPVDGSEYDATASHDLYQGSAMTWITFVAPNPLSGSAEIQIQYVDANNFIGVRIDSGGTLRLRMMVAGVVTDNLRTKAAVALAGETILLAVWMYDDLLQAAYRKAGAWSTGFNYQFVRSGGLGLTGLRVALTDWTSTAIKSWPVRSSLFSAIDGHATSVRLFTSIGDSKTAGSASYQPTLITNLESATSEEWREFPRKFATSGWEVADVKNRIDSDLELRNDTPEYILINLGSNDLIAPMTSESAFKTDYLYILDALHAKWPTAEIYLAKPIRLNAAPPSTPSADSATLATWIDDIVAARPSFAYAGVVEATTLEGGDSYVTRMGDNTHPTAAGYVAMAAAWQAILGY